MGNMMRRGRVNPTCKCCNISDDPGWRTREKNEWKKDVEEDRIKDITPEMICLDPAPADDLIVGEYQEGES